MATAPSLVPARLLESQTLRGPGRPSDGLARFAVVLAACALLGVGAGLLLVRPSPASTVIAHEDHARPTRANFVDGSAVPFQGAGAWVDVWDFAPSYQGPSEAPAVGPADVAAKIGTASAGGFEARELSE
ncbi:MAG: hypothetical protein M3357_17675 [Actinomycetota bacterium]|nr:hypothetical protein [Actinomycetota bacterium]